MELRPDDAMLARTPLPSAAPWVRWPPPHPCLASGKIGRARITEDRECRPPPPGGARRALACRESSASGSHESRGGRGWGWGGGRCLRCRCRDARTPPPRCARAAASATTHWWWGDGAPILPSDESPPPLSLLARCREARDREEARLERDCERDLGTG
jgi:hypothetical protein